MTRAELIERINALSDEDLARVAPYLEADLSAVPHHLQLVDEVRLGRASSESEELVEHDEVLRRVDERLRRLT
ncbi:MAG: hypothetical protein AAF533_10150 [Acidobacteriota bacterium]